MTVDPKAPAIVTRTEVERILTKLTGPRSALVGGHNPVFSDSLTRTTPCRSTRAEAALKRSSTR